MKHCLKFFPLLCLCLVLTAGCNTGKLKTESVTGIVTYDGQPLADALVSFSPKQAGMGQPSYGRTNDKGEYILQTSHGNPNAGTTPGEYYVTVTKSVASSGPATLELPMGSAPIAPSGPVEQPKSAIPEVYGKADTSPLSATVVKGKNKIDFTLKSNP